MKAKWIELSEDERKALRVLVVFNSNSIESICVALDISKASYFNKLKGKTKFRVREFEGILEAIGITKEQLVKASSESYILELIGDSYGA